MSDWVYVARVADLAPGERRVVDVDGCRVLVFNLGGEFHAIEDVCSHDGGELADGALDGDEIVCPRHGARFNVRTGAVTAPPACTPIAALPTRVREGSVEVRDDRWE